MKKIKSIISIILVVIFIAGISTIFVNASVNYNVDGFVLEYYKYKDCQEFMITDYNGDKTSLSTPIMYNTTYISKIAGYSFTNNSKIKSIAINNYINLIGDSAFLNCSSLEEVTIDETVDLISSKAFSACPNLTKVTIKSTDVEIANDAFSNSNNVVIYCYKNSTAEKYAIDNNIKYELLDKPITYKVGDTDGNDDVDILDATLIQKLIAHIEIDEDGKMAERGSYDNSGELIILDATKIQRSLAELPGAELIGTKREYKK